MTDPDQGAILARYLAGCDRLGRSVEGLPEADLDIVPAEGGWTIRQIVHHIADGDEIWKTGIRIALGARRGDFSLEWYRQMEQVEWGERWSNAARPLKDSLELIRAQRAHTSALIDASSGSWALETEFVNPDSSKETISVGAVIAMQADHLEHHVRRIEKIREQIGRD